MAENLSIWITFLIFTPVIIFATYLDITTKKKEKKLYQFLLDEFNGKPLNLLFSGCKFIYSNIDFILDFVSNGSGGGTRRYIRVRAPNSQNLSFRLIRKDAEKYFYIIKPKASTQELFSDLSDLVLYCNDEQQKKYIASKISQLISESILSERDLFSSPGTSIRADKKYIQLSYFIGIEELNDARIRFILTKFTQLINILNNRPPMKSKE